MSARLNLLVIRAANIERTAELYRRLGIDFSAEQHGNGPPHFAADLGGTIFEIYPAKSQQDVDRTTRLGFGVSDLAGTMNALNSRGIEISQEPQESPWGLRAVVQDPDGRAVELYQDAVSNST